MKHPFHYVDGILHAEKVSMVSIAQRFSTPVYVYSRGAIEARYREIEGALSDTAHHICYAVKANSNLAILDLLARLGSGFDIVSVGELERVLAAGGDASTIVFSGVGKRRDEIQRALEVGVRCFNVESAQELDALAAVADALGTRAPVSIRVNPDVDAGTHPYISTGLRENKFGVPIEEAHALYRRAAGISALEVIGIDCHIGSQLSEPAPLVEAMDRVLMLVDALADSGIALEHLDMGGGIGVAYASDAVAAPREFMQALVARLGERDLSLTVEPGRVLVAEAGGLLTRVVYTKHNGARRFAIADAAMNDLIRPALYQGEHPLWPVHEQTAPAAAATDLVGPVCESADFLARDRAIELAPDELVCVGLAGAYSFVMSSNYNSRPRAAEVMVNASRCDLVRERETVADLWRGEHRLNEALHRNGA